MSPPSVFRLSRRRSRVRVPVHPAILWNGHALDYRVLNTRQAANRTDRERATGAPGSDSRAAQVAQPVVSTSAPPRCLDGGDVDLLHRHHRREGTLCLTAASGKRVSQRARGDLPGEAPAVLAPTALTFLAAVADDRVPVAVRLFLIVRCDLEGKGLAVPERRAAVETETGNAQNGELHRQHIAFLAARIVTGCRV